MPMDWYLHKIKGVIYSYLHLLQARKLLSIILTVLCLLLKVYQQNKTVRQAHYFSLN